MKNSFRSMRTQMKLFCMFVFLLSVCGVSPQKIPAEDHVISMTSLEWPPYIGSQLPEQGLCAAIARAAFAEMGYELQMTFYPWARTIRMAKEDARYDGYFPEYYAEELEQDFVFSESIGEGPLGFVERRDAPVLWTSLDDLREHVIGTVRGYVNTTEFDRKIADGELQQDLTDSDIQNLKKVAAGRIPLAVIDRYVMRYLLDTQPDLLEIKELLQFNPHLLEQKQLYLCFRRNEEGERLANIFNTGLKRVDVEKIRQEYFLRIFSD